jgi:hypothetical protein
VTEKEFEDTKGVIRIRKSKKDRQDNGQNKKDKRTKNDLQNIHIKLKIYIAEAGIKGLCCKCFFILVLEKHLNIYNVNA